MRFAPTPAGSHTDGTWGARVIGRVVATPLGPALSGVALAALYLAVAQFSYEFVIPPNRNAVFWIPSGITFALAVRSRWTPRIWASFGAALFLSQLGIVLYHGDPFRVAFAWALANVLLPATAVTLSRRLVTGPLDMRCLRDVFCFASIAVVSSMPGALVAAAGSRWAFPGTNYLGFAASWGTSDLIGVFLLGPVILTWTAWYPRRSTKPTEAVLLFSVLIACSCAIFLRREVSMLDRSLPSLLLLLVAWASIRFGPRAMTLALLVIDLIEVGATAAGTGPFALSGLTPVAQLLNLQMLLGSGGLLMLLLAAAIEEQRSTRIAVEVTMRSKDEFLAVAAHELRTPTTAFLLGVHALGRQLTFGSKTQSDAFSLIEKQAHKLGRLIEVLLDISRIDIGKLEIRPETTDLVELVREVAYRFGTQIVIKADTEIRVFCDRLRLEQVISNLLANAVKFGAEKPVEVSVRKTGRHATVSIRDHGIGIPEDRLPHIFGRYERAVSTLDYGGLGLGLYIARRIMEAHHGTITAENAEGGGARFKISLPADSEPKIMSA